MEQSWTDEASLLCERCGYPLEDLPGDGACPECGKPIRESRPEARAGSAWQVRRSVVSWGATGREVLMRPTRLMSALRVEPGAPRGLLAVNLMVAGAIVATVPTLRLIFGRDAVIPWAPRSGIFAGEHAWGVILATAAGAWLGSAAALWALTWIEYAGIRFFGGRRGWRITRGVARSVCAHASYGWVIAAALLALGWGLVDLDRAIAGALGRVSWRSRLGDLFVAPPALGFFLGMLLFEYRVYQGMRACRFANVRATPG